MNINNDEIDKKNVFVFIQLKDLQFKLINIYYLLYCNMIN